MTTRTFFMAVAAIGVFYGVGFLLVPNLIGNIYGSQINPSATLGYRYFGTALLGFGLTAWAIKDLRDPTMLGAALIGHAASDVAGIFVSAYGTMTGTINGLGWMNVALYTGLLAASLYLYRAMSAVSGRLPA